MSTRTWSLCLVGVLVFSGLVQAEDPAWTPRLWDKEETIKLCTNVPGEGEYCFPVWVVVVGTDIYVRLGSKATERMQKNSTGFLLPIEIAGHRFDHVRATEAPEEAERVAQAMADKYTSDIIIRHFSHPLTLRLRPES